MHKRKFEEPLDKRTILPPIIKLNFSFTQDCIILVCQSCLFACARKRTPYVKCSTACPESEEALSCNRYEVDDFISTDHFICKTPGWLPEEMAMSQKIEVFRGGGFTMMLHWVLFGLEIRFHLVQMRW
jgi:hypothetical protein